MNARIIETRIDASNSHMGNSRVARMEKLGRLRSGVASRCPLGVSLLANPRFVTLEPISESSEFLDTREFHYSGFEAAMRRSTTLVELLVILKRLILKY